MLKKLIGITLIMALIAGCSSQKDEKTAAGTGGSQPAPAAENHPAGAVPEMDPSGFMAELKEELGNGYVIEYEKPFVIAGNISKSEFDRFKEQTIKDCAEAMYKDFFEKRPVGLFKVYLFKNAASYEEYCVKKFGHKPSSPYGFFRDDCDSLIMNIATGGGTLVHEMVHALIRPDFPDVPAWFNEGLGSLFECCKIDGGSLRGEKNWRYPILMDAADKDKLVPLRKLFATSDSEFYGDNSSANYAQARYFCMYMQEKDCLPAFYRQFRDNFAGDETGIKFIESSFGKNIDAIDKEWQEWIKTL